MQHISLQVTHSGYRPVALDRQVIDAAWRALMDSMQKIVRKWIPSAAGGLAGAY